MMRHLPPVQAHNRRPAPLADPHLAPLAGEWALWRDIAVRTAGFPVSGLDVFGSRDEPAGLRAVARDPLFQTAVTWQNRAAMHNAVAKIAAAAPAPASRQRQREETVASYWQRYCAKNMAEAESAPPGIAVDLGCGTGHQARYLASRGWARTVGALAAPGCVLLVRAARRGHRGAGPRGIEPAKLTSLLGDSWLPTPVPAPGWHRYVFTQLTATSHSLSGSPADPVEKERPRETRESRG